MTKKTQHKNLARHQAKIRAAQHHHRRRRRISWWSVGIIAFIAMFVLFLTFYVGRSGEEEVAEPSCDALPSQPWSEPFPMCIQEDGSYTATLKTSEGPITVELLPAEAPVAVNNFAALAEEGYYDGTIFHRVANSIDIIQGGDGDCTFGSPTCGQGGPGYAIDDELTGSERYLPGTVAMANSGPNTAGSQFFIVTGPGAKVLQPNYTIFGRVTDGMDVAREIQQTPVTGETPDEEVELRSVTVVPPLGEGPVPQT